MKFTAPSEGRRGGRRRREEEGGGRKRGRKEKEGGGRGENNTADNGTRQDAYWLASDHLAPFPGSSPSLAV